MALWAFAHVGELTDLDSFDAYLLDPLSYAMALKNLEQGVAEVRDRRLGRTAAPNRGGVVAAGGLRFADDRPGQWRQR